MSTKNDLIKSLKEKKARIAILGLGYVGLPLAVVFGEAGFHVTGVDPDSRKVDSLTKGVSYIPDVKTEAVAKLVKSGHLTATTDFSVLKEIDAVSICVPTPLRNTGDPDMSFIIYIKVWWLCLSQPHTLAQRANCFYRNWAPSMD